MPSQEESSIVEVTCELGNERKQGAYACDTFELGVITEIDYEMYDVFIQVRGIEQFQKNDQLSLDFRMKYYDPNTIRHLMLVKVGLALVSLAWFCFFMWSLDLEDMCTFDQKMILVLVILCVLYDDPLYFLAL